MLTTSSYEKPDHGNAAWQLALLLMGSAIFAVSRLHSFARGARPTPEAIPSSYFGMTLHNYNTTTPWPSIPFASLRTLGHCRELGRHSTGSEYLIFGPIWMR